MTDDRAIALLDELFTIPSMFNRLENGMFSINKKIFPSNAQTYPKYNIILHRDTNDLSKDVLEYKVAVPGIKKEWIKIGISQGKVLQIYTDSELRKSDEKKTRCEDVVKQYLTHGYTNKDFALDIMIPEDFKIVENLTTCVDGELSIIFKRVSKDNSYKMLTIK